MRGFDKDIFGNALLMWLPFRERIGVLTHDSAKPRHPFTLSGTPPTWHSLITGMPYLSFDGAADFLECPAADTADLNLTTEDFTVAAWIYTANSGAQDIMGQGEVNVDGWQFYTSAEDIHFATNQGGSSTVSGAYDYVTYNEWQLLGFTRSGTIGQFYRNGVAVTTLPVVVLDPVSCAGGNKMLVGVYNSEAASFWDGYITLPRIWERKLSPFEMNSIFERERGWFGV